MAGTYREEISPIRSLTNEALREPQQLIFKVEQLAAAGIGEDLAARDGHDFAFTFADFATADVGDAEVVAGDGAAEEALFFHF